MSLCGVATSLTGLKDDIAGHLNTVLSLSGFVGTPAGLLSIQGSVAGILATAKGSVLSVLPDVPFDVDRWRMLTALQIGVTIANKPYGIRESCMAPYFDFEKLEKI